MTLPIEEIEKVYFSIAGSIVGGICVAILTWLFIHFKQVIRNWWFKRVFGQDADKKKKFHIVYGKLSLRKNLQEQDGKPPKFPYFKTARLSGEDGPSSPAADGTEVRPHWANDPHSGTPRCRA